jgi:hypothetical protein
MDSASIENLKKASFAFVVIELITSPLTLLDKGSLEFESFTDKANIHSLYIGYLSKSTCKEPFVHYLKN